MDHLKIIGLRAQNIMRVRVVDFKPNSHVVVVGGNNEQGKTSLLESIAIAFGGSRVAGPEPLRKGAESALIIADLGDIIITRQLKKEGSWSLEVKSKDGTRFPSPQKMLEELVGRVCYDPLHFIKLKPIDQLAELKSIVKLDFTEYDKRYAAAYGSRTDVNRDIKNLEGQVAGLPEFNETLRTEPLDAVELSRKIADAERMEEDLDNILSQGREAATLVNETKEKIASLERELQAQRELLGNREGAAERLREQYAAKKEASKTIDSGALQKELDGIKTQNERINKNNERKALDAKLKAKQDELAKYEKELGDVAIAKEKALTAAKFPIDGLSFNDTGVLYKGTPFEQASGAAKLRTSLAMGIALNPKIRVMIIRDGSLLDEENLAVIAEMAIDNDVQVWIERVGDGEECTIVMEDGEVVEDRQEAPAEKAKPDLKGTRRPTTGPRVKK